MEGSLRLQSKEQEKLRRGDCDCCKKSEMIVTRVDPLIRTREAKET